MRVAETLNGDPALGITAAGVVNNAVAGEVQADIPAAATDYPGVSALEWVARDAAGNILFASQGYLVVNKSLYGPEVETGGPPSIARIRLHLRDNSPADNLWLDSLE